MRLVCAALTAMLFGCASPPPAGLGVTPGGDGPVVVFDSFHRPLPDIPLPNDFASRFDAKSPTRRRINASVLAPTAWERKTREQLDGLDGWGTLAPISVSFDAPLDVENVIRRHHGDRYDTHDDVLLVIDVTEGSPDRCSAMPTDLGEGLFPVRLDAPEYYPLDPRGGLTNLLFEETEEDLDGDGVLDPGEDTDADGILDHPNVRSATDRSLLTFYDRSTRTLIARPVYPLREATTYAVVLTRNLIGENQQAVRSPFAYVNHVAQTQPLSALSECLPQLGFSLEDIAFTWSFTTQAWSRPMVKLRDGLYGLGPFARFATEFPPDPTLRELRTRSPGVNARIAPNTAFIDLARDLYSRFGSGSTDAQAKLFFDNFAFVDFHALGFVESPQLFPRFADDGVTQLPLTDQVWDVDAETGYAFVRREGVNFWLMVPKHRQGPAPVAIFIHGHGSTKFDAINVGGFLARMGIATIGIDAVSHGVDLDPVLLEVVRGQFKSRGLEGMGRAVIEGRALDQNGDGKLDSGVDFWTSYLFHTRDVVRQTALDTMQVVRMLSSFDGVRTWKYDADGDGQPDLAGDFDGDGKVDVGGSAPIHVFGGSLGGILSSYVGGLEPKLDTIVPIIGGGGLADIGTRSSLGGVRDAMVLRMLGPLVLVRGREVFEAVPDLTEYREKKVGELARAAAAGGTAVLRNLDTGEWRCARVQQGGQLRVAVSSDRGHRLALELYEGELAPRDPEGCEPAGEPQQVFDTLSAEVTFAASTYAAGSPLVAFGDGFGLRRANPELRRMLALAQVALEGADPANTAPFMHQERVLTFGTGETVSTRAFYINTLGDSGVPTSSGVTLARAAGLIDFTSVNPRYGVSTQQLLVQTGTVEGTESSRRHFDNMGRPVLLDVDDLQALSKGAGDGFGVPRLSPPLRLVRDNTPAQGGGKSAILFPMMDPTGVHGFPLPTPEKPFDLGSLLIHQLVRYLATSGAALDFDTCQLDWSCAWMPPVQ